MMAEKRLLMMRYIQPSMAWSKLLELGSIFE
jgi:hypothetical protein